MPADVIKLLLHSLVIIIKLFQIKPYYLLYLNFKTK
ncbi:hypothetical protein SPPR111872_09475 [Sphingobacterium prati]